jgi:hypothetical protein
MPQIRVEHFAFPKPGFEFGGQPVAVSEPFGETVMVFGVPAMRRLTIVVVEPPVVTILVVLVFLSKDFATRKEYGQGKNRCRTASNPLSCCHDFLQHLKWAGFLKYHFSKAARIPLAQQAKPRVWVIRKEAGFSRPPSCEMN